MVYAVVILGAVALVAFLVKRDEKGSPCALIFKILTSVLFIITAIFSLVLNPDGLMYGKYIIVGLLFGLVGDIVLDLKFMYPKDNDIYTLCGMSAFSIGHIFYILILILFFGFNIISLLIALAITIAIMFTTIKVARFNYNRYVYIASLYCFLLTYTMTQAFYAGIVTNFNTATILLIIGGVMFTPYLF